MEEKKREAAGQFLGLFIQEIDSHLCFFSQRYELRGWDHPTYHWEAEGVSALLTLRAPLVGWSQPQGL